MYQQRLIDNFINNCKKDKQHILPGLEDLKKQGIDNLSEIKEYNYLNSFLFRALIKNPTAEEEILLTNIWSHNKGSQKEHLKYYCNDARFSRNLLLSVNSSKENFAMVINRGVLGELKNFFKLNPNFFKDNDEFKMYKYPLKKILLCETHGIKINYKILHGTITEEKALNYPKKLFDFISRHKKSVTSEEWDSLIIQLILNASHLNNISRYKKKQKVGDVFFLIEQLNNPSALEIDVPFTVSNYYTSHTKLDFFNSENKNLTEEEIYKRWLSCIKILNNEKFMTSTFYEEFKLSFADEELIEMMKKALPRLISNLYDFKIDKDFYKWPLARSTYRDLLEKEKFKKELLNSICTGYSDIVNQTFYQRIKGKENTATRDDIYDFYINKMLDNPDKNSIIEFALGTDYQTDVFKKRKAMIELGRKLPAKEETILTKIKL